MEDDKDAAAAAAEAGAPLRAFLERHRVPRGNDFTHTSLGPGAGSYYISYDDMPVFFELYRHALADGANLHITEKHRQVSPVCVDVDLRFPATTAELRRRYTREHVDTIVREFAAALDALIEPPGVEGAEFYVMEKPGGPRLSGQVVKDGLHIMAPGIVTRTSLQHIARCAAVERLAGVCAEIGTTNPVGDVFDEAVISRNNWFMYGSKKPDAGAEPYVVTRVVRVSRSPDDRAALVLSDVPEAASAPAGDLVERLSLRNKMAEAPVRADRLSDVLAFENIEVERARRTAAERVMLTSPTQPTATTRFVVQHDEEELPRIAALARLLSLQRLEGYESWMRVGWCLRNIDDSLLPVWVELSKRSAKYVEGECERLWARMRRGTLGVGTLHMWARQDDPDGYRELRSSSIHDLVMDCLTGAHNDVARVVYAMFQHRYVCSSIRLKQWFEFSGHRWKPCDSGYSLRKRLSTDVWREFSAAVNRFNQRAIASNTQTEQQRLQDMTKQVLEIAQRLKNTRFKDDVMKECSEMFYVEKFEERLDSNLHLIGFENGVYDLDADEFRDGRPDDYITFTTGNDYVPYDENSAVADAVQGYLAQVLTKPHMRDYVMKLFSSFLHGAIKEQKFYIWTGSGSNSKSKLVELFELAFGDYCCKLPVTLLTQKRAASNAATSEVAKAKGKRFACMQEPSEDEKMNVGLMKELSGGDKIMARCIYKEPIEFKPQFKMILLCNHLPDVPSDDGGTWRRIRVVEFTSKFVDKPNPANPNEFPIDLDLTAKMETWKEAFMGMLIRYYRRYIEEGIVEPLEVLECTNEYKRQNDHMAEFVETCVEREESSFLDLGETFRQAKAYAGDAGIRFSIARKMFDSYLERSLGGKAVVVNGTKGIRGFRLRLGGGGGGSSAAGDHAVDVGGPSTSGYAFVDGDDEAAFAPL